MLFHHNLRKEKCFYPKSIKKQRENWHGKYRTASKKCAQIGETQMIVLYLHLQAIIEILHTPHSLDLDAVWATTSNAVAYTNAGFFIILFFYEWKRRACLMNENRFGCVPFAVRCLPLELVQLVSLHQFTKCVGFVVVICFRCLQPLLSSKKKIRIYIYIFSWFISFRSNHS